MLTANILQFIPQRYPFVFIDELLFINDTMARTNFIIKKENIFCEDDKFSEAGLLENIAQTAAAANGYRAHLKNSTVKIGFIVSIKNFEVFFLPVINNVLLTEVTILDSVFNFTIIAGKIFCKELLVAQCEMKVLVEPAN